MHIRQIQPIRLRIHLEIAAARDRATHHSLHINGGGGPLIDQSPCRMGNDVEVAVVHRAQQALGLFPLQEVEVGMDRADNQIEPAQHRIRQIERTVLQDIDLDRLQNGDFRYYN